MVRIGNYADSRVDLRQDVRIMSLAEISESADSRQAHGVSFFGNFLESEQYPARNFAYLDDALAAEDTRNTLRRHCHDGLRRFDPVVLVKLRHAIVTGNGSIITCGGALLRESIFEWLNFNGIPPNFTRIDENRLFHAPCAGFAVPGTAAVLKQIPADMHYGHWLVEGVGAAALLRDRIVAERCAIAIPEARDMAMREVICSSLLAVFGSRDPITAYERAPEDAIRFDELYYLTSLHIPLRKSPTGIRAAREAVMTAAGRFGGLAELSARLYISRADANTRRLLNEEEIVRFLAPYGFATVCLEELAFLAKARLFMNAEIIVGVKGAGLANIMFMAPETHALTLSPDDFPNPFYWDMAQQVGVHYSEIYGTSQHSEDRAAGFRDFTIAPDRLERALSHILNMPRARYVEFG